MQQPQASTDVPRVGMLARVRNRRGIVAGVAPYDGEAGRLLKVAAGGFSEALGLLGEVTDPSTRWIEVDSGRRLTADMFTAAVVRRSMEPRIPEGSVCLFRRPAAGSRNGRIVLARLRDAVDPETGERFTVKRYRSEKRSAEDGPWRHVRITLEPLNPEFAPIELVAEDDRGSSAVDILAEFLDVLQPTPST